MMIILKRQRQLDPSSYPVYYIEIDNNIQVQDWGQYVIHDVGYLEIAGTIELGEGGMMIIKGAT